MLVFFNDILIYSLNMIEHEEYLEKVPQLLRENKLYVNEKKCNFGQSQLEYLGHIIIGKGVATNPKKMQDIVQWLAPTDLKGLRGFLDLLWYYKRLLGP